MYPTQDTVPSCLQLVANPVTFSSSQVPPVQPQPNVPQDVSRYTPSLAVLAGNELARLCNVNPAFRYLFNVVVSSSYNGQTWHQIVAFATALFWLNAKNKQASIEALLQEAAATTIIMKASYIAVTNGIVFGNLDLATQNQAREYAHQHERLRPAFEQMTAEYAKQSALASNPQAMAQAYGGLVGTTLAGGGNVSPTDNPYGVANSGVQDPRMPTIGHERLGGLDMLRPLTAPTVVKPTDAFSYYQGATVTPPEPVLEAPKPTVAPAPTMVAHMSSQSVTVSPVVPTLTTRKWRPFEGQFYKPAYHSDVYKLVYELITTNNKQQVVLAMVNLQDEQEMEQSKHKVPAINRMMTSAFENQHNQPPGDGIVSDLDLIVNAISSQKSKDSPELVEKLNHFGIDISQGKFDSNLLDTTPTLQGAINEAKRSKLVSMSKGNVYYAKGVISTSVVTGLQEEELYWNEDSTDDGGIRAFIKNLGVKVSAAKTAEQLNYLNALDRMATNHVNEFIRVKLGIGADIDTAVEDFEMLLRGIGTDFGAVYKTAFDQWCESEESMSCFNGVGYSEITAPNPNPGEVNEVVGHEQFTYQSVGIVLLDMSSSEFGIEFTGAKVLELFSSNFPGLQPFLDTVLRLEGDTGDVVYINTLDDVVFGVTRSVLGDKPVVIFEV